MPTTASTSPLVANAEALARRLLWADPDRLAHCRHTAALAQGVVDILPVPDGPALVAAAWLHDIGYAPEVVRTGFHPLDAATYLATLGWPQDTVRLVAHHSFADVLAPYFGVDEQLALLEHGPDRAEDILAYSDLRSGPTGMGATAHQRITEMRKRPGGRPKIPRGSREARYDLLLAADDRVRAALEARPSAWASHRSPRTPFSGARSRK